VDLRVGDLPEEEVRDAHLAARADQQVRVIDEAFFADHLYTANVDDPDLLIRTSGEMRVSNFLLWQIAYAEIHVTKVLWPDFRKRHLYEAIIDFQARERRYGGVEANGQQMFVEADE
jgi:undecaprenyl diphosphate synthase